MKDLDLNHFISIFIVFISWLLVFFLLSAKSKNYKSNVILALFFLVNAQDSSGLFARYFLYPNFPGLGMLANSTVFFKMPLLFLYFQSVIYSDFKLKKKHLWHFLPWILNILAFTPRFFALDIEAKFAFLNTVNYKELLEIEISYILVHIQMFVYLIWSFKLINTYKLLLLENFSNASLLNYKWLFQFLSIFAIEAFIATLKNVFGFMHLDAVYFYSQILTMVLALGFMCWIVLKALHNPELFRGVNSNLQLIKNIIKKEITSGASLKLIDENETKKIIALKNYMVKKEPFLNPSLSVNMLSEEMKIPDKELSVLINHHLNQHFFDFVNSYRIKKAMKILQDPSKKELTVLEILYEVGFNSKSSFNTAFKKYTQVTPTEYRKTNSKSGS